MAGIESTAQNLGSHIKNARKAVGWSQTTLGRRCGVQRAQISKIEKDVTQASMELFLKICEALKFAISLREQPKAQKRHLQTKSLDLEESLSKLAPNERAALEKRARTILEETTNPFLVILPMVHAKMLELLETDWRQEEEEEVEETEEEVEEVED